MADIVNPWLFPWAGPRLGFAYSLNAYDLEHRAQCEQHVRKLARRRMATQLMEDGYAYPSEPAWSAMKDDPGTLDIGDHHLEQLRYLFPRLHQTDRVLLVDGHWNKRHVHVHKAPWQRITDPDGRPRRHLDAWLDLETGDWLVFTRDNSIGWPLGVGYTHYSRATHHPQPAPNPGGPLAQQ